MLCNDLKKIFLHSFIMSWFRNCADTKHYAESRSAAVAITYFVCQHLLPERPTEVQGLQNWVAVAGVAELGEEKKKTDNKPNEMQTLNNWDEEGRSWHARHCGVTAGTYVDQSKVVFIHGKLFRSNLLFQGWGIGALKQQRRYILWISEKHCRLGGKKTKKSSFVVDKTAD